MHKLLLSCIKSFKLEEAVKVARQYDVKPTVSEMEQIIACFAEKKELNNSELSHHRTTSSNLPDQKVDQKVDQKIDQKIEILKITF